MEVIIGELSVFGCGVKFALVAKGRSVKNMYQKGDYVVYGNEGLCLVSDVTTLDMQNVPKDRLHYVLSPISSKGSTIYKPVDHDKGYLRRIMTKDEVEALIRSIPQLEEFEAINDKKLEEVYRDAMKTCDPAEYLKIIKTSYSRRQQRIRQGKRATAVDDKYFKQAEFTLYSELSVILSLPVAGVSEYIADKLI